MAAATAVALAAVLLAACGDDVSPPDRAPADTGVADGTDAEPDPGAEGDGDGATSPDEPEHIDEVAPDEVAPDEPATDRDHPHLHGAWVHLFDDTLKSRTSIAAMVDELADAGATVIVAQVGRRHDAYYRSDVLPRTPDPAVPADLDVLEELLSAAHARGIQVHAWLSVAPTWHDVYEDLPAPAGWLPTEHGHLADEADRWLTRTVDGVWSPYLDPALPEVRAHVVAVVEELVDRYPVDGIHLDYVRYESQRHGYHPRVVDAYLDEVGASVAPAPDDPRWSQWRRDRTRQLIVEVAAALEARAPDVLLSAAVISWGAGPGHADAATFAETRTAAEALQDWPGWARDGILDAVMPMHYFRQHDDEQRGWLDSWLDFDAQLAGETETLVVPGVGGWLNAPEATLAQAVRAREHADGVLVYSFQQPTDDGSRSVWRDLHDAGWGAPHP